MRPKCKRNRKCNLNKEELDKKIKEIENYMNYTPSQPLWQPEQIWKKSEQISMDDIIQIDPDFKNEIKPTPTIKPKPKHQECKQTRLILIHYNL